MNHAVILPDAHKEQTINALLGASFGAAGQRCMAVSVAILVGEARQWVPDMVAKAKGLKVGHGKDNPDLGPVISRAAFDRVTRLIDRGVEEGATLELDGRLASPPAALKDGNFIAPRILGGATGLSGLGVLLAIVVGGELFGIPGMVAGVPTLAVLAALARQAVGAGLTARGLPEEPPPAPQGKTVTKKAKN